jgi:GMP synthase (glutamine-hydrolysing)
VVAQDRLLEGLKDDPVAAAPRRVDEPRRPRRRSAAGFIVTARTDAFRSPRWPTTHAAGTACSSIPKSRTRAGQALLRRFVVDICGCQTLWTAANIIEDQIERVRAQVGSDEVILGLSGGVDSSVVAALLHQRDRRPPDLRVRRHRPAALGTRATR